jgi:hypothetical protein
MLLGLNLAEARCSSVGRAVDCSTVTVIHRSLVRFRSARRLLLLFLFVFGAAISDETKIVAGNSAERLSVRLFDEGCHVRTRGKQFNGFRNFTPCGVSEWLLTEVWNGCIYYPKLAVNLSEERDDSGKGDCLRRVLALHSSLLPWRFRA